MNKGSLFILGPIATLVKYRADACSWEKRRKLRGRLRPSPGPLRNQRPSATTRTHLPSPPLDDARRTPVRWNDECLWAAHARLRARPLSRPRFRPAGPILFILWRLLNSKADANQVVAVASPSSPCRKPRQPRRERSARLKSSPVETSARNVVGLRATPRSTLRRSMSPFGLMALLARAGSDRLAGSEITRKAANGSPASAA